MGNFKRRKQKSEHRINANSLNIPKTEKYTVFTGIVFIAQIQQMAFAKEFVLIEYLDTGGQNLLQN